MIILELAYILKYNLLYESIMAFQENQLHPYVLL